jgi:hypothetical protein
VPVVLKIERLPLDTAIEHRAQDARPLRDGQLKSKSITLPAVLKIDRGRPHQKIVKRDAHELLHESAVHKSKPVQASTVAKVKNHIRGLSTRQTQLRPMPGQPSARKRRHKEVEEFTLDHKKQALLEEGRNRIRGLNVQPTQLRLLPSKPPLRKKSR